MLSTFAFTGALLQIKTDNRPVFKNHQFIYLFIYWETWKIAYHIGISHNPQGQAIIKRTHQALRKQLVKQAQSSLPPNSQLNMALFILHVLNAYATQDPHLPPHCLSLQPLTMLTIPFSSMEGPTWQVLEGARTPFSQLEDLLVSFHRINLVLSGYQSTMLDMTPAVKKMALLSITEKTKRKRFRTGDPGHLGRHTCPCWYSPTSDPTQPSLSIILMTIFALLGANAHTLPSPPSFLHWCFFVRETYQGHNIILGSGNCPTEGCQSLSPWSSTPIPPNIQMPLSFTSRTDNSDSNENAWLR